MDKWVELKLDFLISCEDDYVGLWELIRSVQSIFGLNDLKKIKAIVLDFILKCLTENIVNVGLPLEDGTFVNWDLNCDGVIKKIDNMWDLSDPGAKSTYEIWFNLTEKGEKKLEQLRKEND